MFISSLHRKIKEIRIIPLIGKEDSRNVLYISISDTLFSSIMNFLDFSPFSSIRVGQSSFMSIGTYSLPGYSKNTYKISNSKVVALTWFRFLLDTLNLSQFFIWSYSKDSSL